MLPIPSRARLRRSVPRLLLGLVLCGSGIASMVLADLGLGPWDVLHQGLSGLTGIPIGTVSIGVGFIVLLGWIPLRERIGIGTLANVVMIGAVIDLWLLLLDAPDSMVARVPMMLAGPVLFGVGSGFYIGALLGPGPRDGLMTGIARRGVPIYAVRAGIEVTVLAVGFLLGGTVGIGTIWMALGIGPLVHLSLHHLSLREPEPETATGAR
ncbi:MAG: hypothetical protein U5R31_11630 [Acidimicrobiia bacterium]|nr:hypothetical protein [Acidimicrobiia bacterium]